MSAEAIARALGGTRQGRGYLCRCPNPTHGKGRGDTHPSLSVWDGDRRVVFKCHAGCPTPAIEAQLGGLVRVPPRAQAPQDDRDARTAQALSIWNAARDPECTLVETYLHGRGLTLGVVGPGVVRFAPSLWYEGGSVPGMVALMRDINTNAASAVHRTFLSPDGTKLGRKSLGPIAKSAIKLWPVSGNGRLVICEGLETGLAAMSMGFMPAWALGSAGSMARFPVLSSVRSLAVVRENDSAGAAAADEVARRWRLAGREVSFVHSPVGSDLADLIRERVHASR